jgi:hypothetical protein
MHDPTEGGIAAALWELSEACGYTIEMDSRCLPISPLSKKICDFFELIRSIPSLQDHCCLLLMNQMRIESSRLWSVQEFHVPGLERFKISSRSRYGILPAVVALSARNRMKSQKFFQKKSRFNL